MPHFACQVAAKEPAAIPALVNPRNARKAGAANGTATAPPTMAAHRRIFMPILMPSVIRKETQTSQEKTIYKYDVITDHDTLYTFY